MAARSAPSGVSSNIDMHRSTLAGAATSMTDATPQSSAPPRHAARNDVAVFIGRFAPFHLGHLAALRAALESYRCVIVVVGSTFQAATPRNPFTWRERADMISISVGNEEAARIRFVAARDHHRDERWAEEVVQGVLAQADGVGQRQITVVNPPPAHGQASFDWPRMFPRWGHQPLRLKDEGGAALDSAAIRNVLFCVEDEAKRAALTFLREAVPEAVRHYLSAWWESPLRTRLADEAEWVRQYRTRWPADQAMTTDAVVTCSDHVLLIERGEGAGAGLFAVPGGFLEKNERFYDGAKRELREETGLGYIGDGLDVAFAGSELFDRPDRSLRARIVTVAHLFDLKSTPLPDVQGRDDARHALWVPMGDLLAMEDRFFEDHFQILDHFLGLTRRQT
jgi:bifunctional NMN adenylyltransferase/nudix hydrolase